LRQLRRRPTGSLFQLDEAPLVAAGYHVAEIKAGLRQSRREIQLWSPGDETERELMTFLLFGARVQRQLLVSVSLLR